MLWGVRYLGSHFNDELKQLGIQISEDMLHVAKVQHTHTHTHTHTRGTYELLTQCLWHHYVIQIWIVTVPYRCSWWTWLNSHILETKIGVTTLKVD